MPLSTDVNLPKDHKPRFPKRCIVCGRADPSSTVRLITGAIGWWTWLLWIFGTPFTVRAPSCSSCGWRLHLRRFGGLLIAIGIACLALTYLWPLLADHVPNSARGWAMMGLALVCVVPYFAYETFRPPPFCITAFSDSVDYEFRDPRLALEFAELNEDAEWVKVS